MALAVQCRRDSLGIWPQEGRGPLPPPWWVAHWAGLVSSREVGEEQGVSAEASELPSDCSHFADEGAEVPGQGVRRLGHDGRYDPGGWTLGQDLFWTVFRLSRGWGLDSRSDQL